MFVQTFQFKPSSLKIMLVIFLKKETWHQPFERAWMARMEMDCKLKKLAQLFLALSLYDFCLWLSHEIFTARIMEKSYTISKI